MAIQRRITADFQPGDHRSLNVDSEGFGRRVLILGDRVEASPAGDWANYLKAALAAVEAKWPITHGFHAQITSDLPSAAGLSSSSALLTAFTLGLLRANDIQATLDELMSILPEAEHFVGTRGGGMDHAAVLASRASHASLLQFAPFHIDYVPVPADWRFLLAHSLTRAEKSGAAKARYNACRTAGLNALSKYGFASYKDALQVERIPELSTLTIEERHAFTHVVTEAKRVTSAVANLRAGQRRDFGELLLASHASLRDLLRVSCPALDQIVAIAKDAGADGARLTGAGFGGCAIILCPPHHCETIVKALERDFYSGFPEYKRQEHLLMVEPSNGALNANHN